MRSCTTLAQTFIISKIIGFTIKSLNNNQKDALLDFVDMYFKPSTINKIAKGEIKLLFKL